MAVMKTDGMYAWLAFDTHSPIKMKSMTIKIENTKDIRYTSSHFFIFQMTKEKSVQTIIVCTDLEKKYFRTVYGCLCGFTKKLMSKKLADYSHRLQNDNWQNDSNQNGRQGDNS